MAPDLHVNRTTVRLARDGVIGIEDGRGLRVGVSTGSVWLTQQGDGRDVVLRAGESFVIDRRGRTVVQALAPAEFSLAAAGGTATPTYQPFYLQGAF